MNKYVKMSLQSLVAVILVAQVSHRGSTFDQVLVMINGVRVNDPQTGHHTLDLPLPFEAVQQVEVLAGAGATLYGSDAVGGTLNFVTKKPESKELRLMGGMGEHGWNRLAASSVVTDAGVDFREFTRLIDRPLAVDAEERAAYLGTSAGDRGEALATLQAPDFTLPDVEGKLHSLSDYRGKKILLVAYASW